jgi:3-hydroxyisobutyrate dehydrogenase-like beta-hydroxyacid dehydrogenase
MKVTFIGLGVMGYPMAGHLAQSGHQVRVFNRTSSKAQAWAEQYDGQACDTVADAVQGSEIVFLCVGDDADVRERVAQVIDAAAPGTVIVDHTTTSAQVARDMDQACQVAGMIWIDAPVSGGQAGAENGQLTIMCGGEPDSYAKAEPVMNAYARQARLMGPAGSGQLTKMVNQICIAGLLQGLAEGLSFANAAGLDGEAVVEVISKGAAQSWQMENRYQTMLADEYDLGFAVQWMRKDLGHVLAEARRNGAALPVTATVDQFYKEVENLGGGRWDTSSLFKRLETLRNAKL